MKIKSIFKSLSLLAVMVLAGCAQPAKMEKMVVGADDLKDYTINTAFSNAISVEPVSGGQETNPLWMSDVASKDFELALVESLKGIGSFSADNSGYALNAKLLSVKKPFMGFNMTVHSRVHYTLTDLKTKTALFDEDIEASYTATVGDAFMGIKRLQLANEGAIRENIRRFLLALSELKLQ
ncbi:MAG TPA: hypothetical protein DD412_05665 [Holosporales bacterium]|nr:hypothetical protein [Holosporales bacterium]